MPRAIKANDSIDITPTEFAALQERARDVSCPTYLGTDCDGRLHFCNRVRTDVAVFSDAGDTDPSTDSLPAQSFRPHIDRVSAGPGWRDLRMDQ